MEFYWELIQHDGTRLEIPPAGVEVVKRRMANGDPINTRTMVVPANQIKHFRQTNKPYGQQPLLEAAAQAFDEPLLSPEGSMAVRWVKKHVTQHEYNKMYAAIPAYHSLGEDNGMAVVAFRLPIHEIDVTRLDYCTEAEVKQLTRT